MFFVCVKIDTDSLVLKMKCKLAFSNISKKVSNRYQISPTLCTGKAFNSKLF